MVNSFVRSILLIIVYCLSSNAVFAQFQYISPLPGSKMHHPQTNIILRNGNLIAASTLRPENFVVSGSASGRHDVDVILSDDGKTILLQPTVPFANNESVTVTVSDALRTKQNEIIKGTEFTFQTEPLYNAADQQRLADAHRHVFEEEFGTAAAETTSDTRDLSDWTGGLPPLTIWANNNPAPGSVFFHNFDFSYQPTAHYCIMGNNADSVYGKFDQTKGIGFTINQNGYLTLFNNNLNRHEMLDSNYKMIDKFYCGNGYIADVHEFIVLPNGHSYLIADDPQYVDMTVYNPNYNPNAVVIGAVIQELDASKHVVFQWRSWDHFEITDATHILLSTSEIDYVHANSIQLEADGTSFLLSSRHMDEVTKISFTTGDIIWRLGGLHNEFTFIGDPQKFSYQHDVRRLSNGHLTVFDNGNYHSPAKSAAKEYILDETNKTITLTWKYERNLTGSSSAMGSMQRLPNGNTFICWGLVYSVQFPSVTEVTAQGDVVWEMRLDPEFNDGIYRSHRFEWTPCSRPSFGTMQAIDITAVSAKLKWSSATNAGSYQVQYKPTTSSVWTTKNTNKKSVTVGGLAPNTTYDWQVRSICSSPNPPMSGYTAKRKFTTLPQKIADDLLPITLNAYPNPASGNLTLDITLSADGPVSLHVYNMLGQQQMSGSYDAQSGTNSIAVDVSRWANGIYFVEAVSGTQRTTGKITIE